MAIIGAFVNYYMSFRNFKNAVLRIRERHVEVLPLRYDLYTCTVNNHSFVDLDQPDSDGQCVSVEWGGTDGIP